MNRTPCELSWLARTSVWMAFALTAVGTSSTALPTFAQVPSPPSQKTNDVLATVNGFPITAEMVQRDLERTTAGIQLGTVEAEKARKATLKKLIDQRVAYAFLEKHQISAGKDEVDLRLEELKTELATVEKTIDDYLDQTSQTIDEFKFQMAWQISWQRYLDRKLTDEFLESHFLQNQRSMDGTELHVAHLLLKLPPNPTSDQVDTQMRQAESIAQQLETGTLSWDAAVAQYSEAPSKSAGGEIGWIKIDGPMPRTFTRQAFELADGKISQPVTTAFGIHLIKCLEIKPGTLGWRDVIDQVKSSASRAYFDAIVAKHRPEVSIE